MDTLIGLIVGAGIGYVAADMTLLAWYSLRGFMRRRRKFKPLALPPIWSSSTTKKLREKSNADA